MRDPLIQLAVHWALPPSRVSTRPPRAPPFPIFDPFLRVTFRPPRAPTP